MSREYSDLDSFMHKDGNGTEEQSKKVVEALRKILRRFLLRIVKSDVKKNLLPSEFQAGISVVHDKEDSCWWIEKEINISDGDADEVVSVGVGEGHQFRQWCVTSPS
jgi:hypothetical protein